MEQGIREVRGLAQEGDQDASSRAPAKRGASGYGGQGNSLRAGAIRLEVRALGFQLAKNSTKAKHYRGVAEILTGVRYVTAPSGAEKGDQDAQG